MKPIISTQYLLHKLRHIENVKAGVFKEIFSSYRECLAAGLDFYFVKKTQPRTKEELIKDGIDEAAANFVFEAAEMLDIDSDLCYDIFTAYLLYDYAGPTRDVKALLGDEEKRKALFVGISDYFHRERVCQLLSIIEILKLIQKPPGQLPHLGLLKDFVFDTLAVKSFVDKLLASFNAVWKKNLEAEQQSKRVQDISTLAGHYFTLQETLVRVLIWLFYVTDLPVECDMAVLNVFTDQNFGRKQFYKKYLPTFESDDRVDRIFYLEILFILKLLQLESLLFLHYDPSGDTDIYWLDDHQAQRVTSILEASLLSRSQDHAGLALAYAVNAKLRSVLHSRGRDTNGGENSEVSEHLEAVVAKYGAIARSGHCLKFCNQFLSSPAITADKDMRSLARAVIFVALDGCLEFFEPASLGSAEDMAQVLFDVLKDENTAEVFWSKNFVSGASVHVLNEFYKFNYNFERPLRILQSLAGASLESCQKVSNFWRRVPVLSESIESIDHIDVSIVEETDEISENGNGGPTFILLKPRCLFGEDGIAMPAGTRGRVMQEPGNGKEFVQWEFSYNAWQLCLLEMGKSDCTRVSLILDLVGEVMEMDPSTVTLFVHFLKVAVKVLNRLVYFETELPVDALQSCLRCLAFAAKTFPFEVLSQLSQDSVLPNAKGQQGFARLSLISRILNDVERLSGSYDCTISFLRMIEFCSEETACYDLPSFIGSISYICERVLADFLSWRYERLDQRNEIATICLRLCRKVFEVYTTSTAENTAAVKEAVDICRTALTQSEARKVLLRLACVGLDSLKDPCDQVENGNYRQRLADNVCLSLALLLELLIDFDTTRQPSTPQIFVDIFLPVSRASNVMLEPPLCAIGRYLFLALGTDGRIPKLAIICLKRIAKQFKAIMLSSLGDWASAFCDAFLTRLESPTEDVHLKVNCVEFLTTAIEYQPGLAEQMLGGSMQDTLDEAPVEKRSKVGSSDGGALDCVLSIMKSDRLHPDLAVACMNLFAELWRVNNTTAMDYLRNKRKEDFWATLIAPLSAGEEDYYLAIVSPIFRILARELYVSYERTDGSISTTSAAEAPAETSFVTTIVKEITEPERIQMTFKKLQDYCLSSIDSKEKVDVLNAWTDFLQVLLRGTMEIPSKMDILEGSVAVLKTVLTNFVNADDLGTVHSAADLCSLALKYCNGSVPQTGLIKQFASIFYRINDSSVEEWILSLASAVMPSCCAVFQQSQRLERPDTDILPTIFDAHCSFLVKIFINTAMLCTRNLLSSSAYPWKEALKNSLHCLALIYNHTQSADEKTYLEVIRKHSVLWNLRVLSASLLEAGHFDEKLFTSTCLVFEMATRSVDAMSIIRHSGFLEWICVKFVVAPKEIIFNVHVLTSLFNLYASMVETGGHNVVDETATFLASYYDIIAQLLHSLPTNPTPANGKAVLSILRLLISLGHYKDRWRFEASESQTALISSVSVLCFRLPSYLSKPTALADVVHKSQEDKTPKMTSSGATLTPVDMDQRLHAIQQMFFEVLFLGVQFLLCFSPDLSDVCNNPSFDPESFHPLVSMDLNTNLAPDVTSQMESGRTLAQFTSGDTPPLTFGAVLLTIHVCVNLLRKHEPAKSASPAVHPLRGPQLMKPARERTVIAALLECSMYFVVSQASLYLMRRRDGLDDWQRALLKRDLAAELSQYLSRSGIRGSGGSAPSTPGKSPTPITPSITSPLAGRTTSIDIQFLRFVSDFVRDVLRNDD